MWGATDSSNMGATQPSHMADDQYRSLLTKKEYEILMGDADVSEKYYYRVVTRVRKKIKGVEHDLEALEQHNSLADELRGVVCDETDDDGGEQ